MTDLDLNRRKVILSVGAATAGLAGCVTTQNEDNGGNASEPQEIPQPEREFSLDSLEYQAYQYLVEGYDYLHGDREEPPDRDFQEPNNEVWQYILDSHQYLIQQKE